MNRICRMVTLAIVLAILLCGGCRPFWCRSDLQPTPITTPVPTTVSRGLAYGVPCKPPCWEGLVPGVSTGDDLRRTLQDLRANGQIASFNCSARACIAYYLPGVFAGHVSILLEDEVVTLISGDINFDFRVQQLVDSIGEPQMAYSLYATKGCTCQGGGDNSGESREGPIELLYLERGASFGLRVPIRQAGCVCPQAKVTMFEYFPPMSLPEYLDFTARVYGEAFPYVLELQESNYVEWHGFGPGYSRK
jgi:hypothetical protein